MRFDPSSLPFPEPFPGPFKSHRASLPVSAETSYPPAEKLDRIDLIGKIARLSNGSSGTILHVEYEGAFHQKFLQSSRVNSLTGLQFTVFSANQLLQATAPLRVEAQYILRSI